MFLSLIISAFCLATLPQTTSLYIGDAKLIVEIADTPQSHAQGLMHRETLPPNHGMLFVYDQPQTLSFWMKNTKIPLSIGFFDAKQKLVQIHEMTPQDPKTPDYALRQYFSNTSAKYALEAPSHWFEENQIQIGEHFTLENK